MTRRTAARIEPLRLRGILAHLAQGLVDLELEGCLEAIGIGSAGRTGAHDFRPAAEVF